MEHSFLKVKKHMYLSNAIYFLVNIRSEERQNQTFDEPYKEAAKDNRKRSN